ncbi:MAG TPA: DUF1330 domain-containing protein [Xanthobacteraceae bacterium]
MKTLFAAASAMITGFGLGILVDYPLSAQTAPPAYVFTLFDIGLKSLTDTNYPSLNPATFQPFGGHYIIHFGTTDNFDGLPPNQIVVIAFDSMKSVRAWHSSEAFRQSYNPQKLAGVRAFAVEGIIP